MIWWLLAAGLLASGPYHNAKGYSGQANIDFGRAIPGHSYNYRAYFKNEASVPLRLSGRAGCGSCPHFTSRSDFLAPGDSTELNFETFLKRSVKDSFIYDVLLYTDDGGRRGLWMYRVRLSLRDRERPWVRTPSSAVKVDADHEGNLQGRIPLVSLSSRTLRLSAVGYPDGLRFHPVLPAEIMPYSSLALVFTAPPEVLAKHRSLTFELRDPENKYQRFSLPLAP